MVQKTSVRRWVAELLLIVVGILSAFGLESWWDQRSVSATETEALTQMLGEFQAAAMTLDNLVADHSQAIQALQRLDDLLAPGRVTPPRDSVAVAALPLWGQSYYLPSMPAYEELISSGSFLTLSSPELKRALTQYGLSLRRNADWEEYWRNSATSWWEPPLADRVPQGPEDYWLMPDSDELASDLAFRSLTRLVQQVNSELIEIRGAVGRDARTVAALIETRLGH